MHEHVTFLRPEPAPSDPRRISAALPADLLEQVRERVRVLTSETTMGPLLKHLQETPSSPSTRGVPVPVALDNLVLSCLEKDPNDRPQSARELSGLLAEIGGPTVWTEDRARGWWAQYQPIRA